MDAYARCAILLAIFQFCVCPPVTKKAETVDHNNVETNEVGNDKWEQLGIEYSRYLKQVVETLESDADFRSKLEKAAEADIRSGKIAVELEFVNHNVRSKLDELKRQELERLRSLAKMAMEKENNSDSHHLQPPEHLDHGNPNSFEIADLHKLIQKITQDLDEADNMRRQDFKQYEMQKQFEQEEKMKEMNDDQKSEYKEELDRMKKKHLKHEKLHHPGSKQQLQEVWEKQDQMSQQQFDPRTFFYLHDLDGNGFWDQEEVKALFLKELDKLYEAGLPEDDMAERAEEMERMREHVFQETDLNKDRMISYEEFLKQTKTPEFERDPGWDTLDQQQVYTPEEYAAFEKLRQQEIQRLIKAGRLPPHPPGMVPPGAHPGMQQYQQPHMQQGQYAQHPNSVYQQQQYAQQQQQYAQQQQAYAQQQYQAQQQQQLMQQQQQQLHPQQQAAPGGYQVPQGVQNQPNAAGISNQQVHHQNAAGSIPQPDVQQPVGGNIPQQVPQHTGSNIPQQPVGQVQPRQVPQQPVGQNPQQPIGQVHQQPIEQVHQQPIGQVHQQPIGQVHQQPIGQVHQQPIGQVHQQPTGQVHQQPPQYNAQAHQQLNAQGPKQPIPKPVEGNVLNNDINIGQAYDPNSINIPEKQVIHPNAVPSAQVAPSGIPRQPQNPHN